MKISLYSFLLLMPIILGPGYAQNKPVAAIGPIQVGASNISCKGWDAANCNQDLSFGFRQMLETAIAKSGKLDLMERGQLDVILAEKGLGMAGFTQTGGRIEGLTGVDYYVYGTITSFGQDVDTTTVSGSSGIGSLFGGQAGQIFGAGINTSEANVRMGVDLKVSEVATGKIMIADSLAEKFRTGSSYSIGGISQSDIEGDPFAGVQRILAARIAEKIVTALIPIKVIKVQKDGVLILNYGDIFLNPGEQLKAFEVGESFIDPDTGETLGSEEIEMGRVEITRTEAKFSRAVVIGEQFNADGAILRKVKASPEKQNEASKPKKTLWGK